MTPCGGGGTKGAGGRDYWSGRAYLVTRDAPSKTNTMRKRRTGDYSEGHSSQRKGETSLAKRRESVRAVEINIKRDVENHYESRVRLQVSNNRLGNLTRRKQ